MCGIVGYVGPRAVQEVLLGGLEKLEYRGYDSAGISVLCDGRFDSVRSVGNLSALRTAIDGDAGNGGGAPPPPPAAAGVGHTPRAAPRPGAGGHAHPPPPTEDPGP